MESSEWLYLSEAGEIERALSIKKLPPFVRFLLKFLLNFCSKRLFF